MDPTILPHLPTAPDHVISSIIVNPILRVERGAELRQRFNSWLEIIQRRIPRADILAGHPGAR